jgi:hypothetical protein
MLAARSRSRTEKVLCVKKKKKKNMDGRMTKVQYT